MLYQNPNIDRIYEGFNYADNGWKGRGSQSDSDTFEMVTKISFKI